MKKIPHVLFIVVVVLSMAACGAAATPTAAPAAPPTAVPVTEVPTDTAETEAPAAEGALPEELVAELDLFLQSLVYQADGDPTETAPGVILMVDTPDGRYLQAAGVSSLEEGTPMQAGDRVEIGSNTKSFTIVLLEQLQEQGVLSMDDPLSMWLPDLAAQIPYGQEITLRQLALHTSGVWDYGDAIIGESASTPALLERGYAPEELVQYAIDNGTPDFEPGEEAMFKYSNTGYILLGMVIEEATGQKMADLYQERIFDPLGLETAGMIEGVPQKGEIISGYFWTEDTSEQRNTTNWNASQGWAAGAIAITAEDLARYAKGLAAGDLFQNPESLEEMKDFLPYSGFGMGLLDMGHGYWGHEGQTAGYQTVWAINPETGNLIVGLSNSASFSAFSFLKAKTILSPELLAPAGEPAASEEAAPAGEEVGGFAGLTASAWQWQSFTDPLQQFDVENPDDYILTLLDDGTIQIKADCNDAGGSYTATDGGEISIEIGATTRAACPPDSRSEEFLQNLGFAAGYFFLEGNLFIDMIADGGTMEFGPLAVPADSDLEERTYPVAEPDYDAKLGRDLDPFEDALASLSPERAAELDQLLGGTTIPEIQEFMEQGQLTAAELVTYYVARIQLYDIDKLNSVMELNAEALEIANQLDEERSSGQVRGDMHGIPVLLKANVATGDGMKTTAGAVVLQDWQPERDAFLVQQLRDAGAIILGKANLSEWANYMDPSMPDGFSALGGQTRHPYGPFNPLGSSTGSAVSTAANLTTVSVGTETQGSVILPAKVNGVAAIKTSRGLVSRDHIIPLVDWLDVPGPMGRSVTDVAILLTAMTGTDENDPATQDAVDLAGTDFRQFLSLEAAQDLRVGVVGLSEEAMQAQVDATAKQLGRDLSPEELALVGAQMSDIFGDPQAMTDAFNSQGIETVFVDLAKASIEASDTLTALEFGFQDSFNSFVAALGASAPVTSLTDVVAFNEEDLANRAPYGQGHVEESANTAMTAEDYETLKEEIMESSVSKLRGLFEEYDVDVVMFAVQSFTQEYAPAGFPALTVPNGLGSDGMPVGVILIGDYLSEPQLIAVGYAYEQATQARVEPDLEATLQQIQDMKGDD